MRKILSCFITVMGCVITSFGQNNHPSYQHLTTNDGLAHNQVKAILQDSKGFVWLGTNEGLNRYDGYEFKVYEFTPFDSCSIRDNGITSIVEDKNGKLWVATFNGGLHVFDPITECFRQVPIPHIGQPQDGCILKVHLDKQGFVWVITEHLILKKIDPNTHKVTSFGQRNKFQYTSGVQEDASGRYLYLNIRRKDVAVFDKHQGKFITPSQATRFKRPKAYDTQEIVKDAQGKLWIYRCSANKLQRINIATGETAVFEDTFDRVKTSSKNSKANNSFRSFLIQDNKGLIWKSNTGGMSAFDPQEKRFVGSYQLPITKKNIWVHHPLIDQSGKVWLGTNAGVYMLKLSAKPLKTFNVGKITDVILTDPQGTVWVGGKETLTAFFANGTNKTYKFASYFKPVPCPASGVPLGISGDPLDREHILWVTVAGFGLLKFDKKTETFTRYKPKGSNEQHLINAYAVLIDPNEPQIIWLGCDNGLQKFDVKNETFQLFAYQYPQGNLDEIRKIYKDSQGMLWLATFHSGIVCFDPKKRTYCQYLHDPTRETSLSNNSTVDFCEDKHGNFWIASEGGGLNLLDRKKQVFRHYTRKNGLPSNYIKAISEDKQGRLWLATHHGICQFDPVSKTPTNYDQRDGLPEYNLTRAFYQNQRGKMFFGGQKSVIAFHPEQLVSNTYIPSVFITKFKKFNQAMPLYQAMNQQQELALCYKDAAVSFEFAALSFYQSNKNQYAYKLEGLHQEWVQLGSQREITFANLAPGVYTLRVKASNNAGVWNEEGVTLKIRVTPPWWATDWFRLGAALFVLLTVVAGYSWRLQQARRKRIVLERLVDERTADLKKLNHTKDRFFGIIAHDLRGPLASFQQVNYLLNHHIKKQRLDRVKTISEQIDASAQKLNRLLNNLLDWAMVQQKSVIPRPEKLDLYQQVQDCMAAYQGSLDLHHIQIENKVSQGQVLWADPHSVTSLIQNLIGNATKFTPDWGTIEITTQHQENELVLAIQDSGIGMDAATLKQMFELSGKKSREGLRGEQGVGLGLTLCQEFARLNNATLTVDSIPGKGSTFYVTFRGQKMPINQPNASILSED
ncbi:two-component regulator propeller domain-containing protein [uncultured Microscilla sp.]|uniref:ligand-binding sensor domain-containing protein n=1 Tax=uncultured Microscilla sp. TaxID=432653 RepID=UPI00262E90A6|nr:two-component regulator propeller domain-containing protein [uncultured Microscilla sp.]